MTFATLGHAATHGRHFLCVPRFTCFGGRDEECPDWSFAMRVCLSIANGDLSKILETAEPLVTTQQLEGALSMCTSDRLTPNSPRRVEAPCWESWRSTGTKVLKRGDDSSNETTLILAETQHDDTKSTCELSEFLSFWSSWIEKTHCNVVRSRASASSDKASRQTYAPHETLRFRFTSADANRSPRQVDALTHLLHQH